MVSGKIPVLKFEAGGLQFHEEDVYVIRGLANGMNIGCRWLASQGASIYFKQKQPALQVAGRWINLISVMEQIPPPNEGVARGTRDTARPTFLPQPKPTVKFT